MKRYDEYRAMETPEECCVVLVGDTRVGKTCLVSRNIGNKFSENYSRTSSSAVKYHWTSSVANRKVRYTIWDTSGGSRGSHSRTRSLIYSRADVFLLCYKISDPATLYSALNNWTAEIRSIVISTPIILVGCQSDLRTDREVLSNLSRQGQAPVSAEQGLTVSQEIGAVLYVETSSKSSARAAISAFEVAALTSLGKLGSSYSTIVPPKPPPPPRRAVSHMALNKENFYSPEPARSHLNIATLSTPKLHFKASRDRSMSSLLSLSSPRTPKQSRKSSSSELTVTIKCQRLNADREYEEVEVQVPAPIYETLKFYNENRPEYGDLTATPTSPDPIQNEKKSFRSRFRKLFLK